MTYIDDFADKYWSKKEEELMRMPVCSVCGEHIQDEYCVELPDGQILCNECEDDNAASLWQEFGREAFVAITKGLVNME